MYLVKRGGILLAMSAGLAAIAALRYQSLPPDVTQPQPQRTVLRLDVCADVPDRIDIDPPVLPEMPPYQFIGVIFERGGIFPIGSYRCWRDPKEASVVHQVFSIDGCGSIVTEGLESFANGTTRPVVGGNGEFMDVRGEGTIGPSLADGCQPPCSTAIGFEIDFVLLY